MTSRLCDCPEPPARGEDWPDNAHTHAGCRVYHKGKACRLDKQKKLPLEPEGKRGANSFGDEVDV